MIPIKVTYTGDTFAGKNFAKQARVQVGMLKDDMKHLGLQQGRRFVTISPGITIESRSIPGLDEARVHVTPLAGQQLRKNIPIEEIFKWYWYAVSVSEDDMQVFISTGGSTAGVAIDGMKNVYTSGFSRTRDFTIETSDLSNEAVFLKYNTDGKFLFRRVLAGGVYDSIDRNESGTGVAIDFTLPTEIDTNYGGVYFSSDFSKYRDDFCYDNSLLKYEYDGTIKWKKRLSLGDTGLNDIFNWGVESDASGNAVMVGLANIYNGATAHSPWAAYEFMYSKGYLVSFAYDGTLNWSKQIGDPLPDVDGWPTVMNYVKLYDVAVDSVGNIVIGGSINEAVVGNAIPAGLLVKLDGDGTVLWKRAIEGWLRKRDNNLDWYGLYAGTNVTGCEIDTDGYIYAISLTKVTVATNSGWYHYHFSKISSDGTLQWQRFWEVEYFSDTEAEQFSFVAQLAVGVDGVYVIFPRFSNAPDVPLAHSIIKFQKQDAVVVGGPLAGDVLWQRTISLSLSAPFTSYTGLVLRSIKVVGADIYLAGQVAWNVSSMVMKLPGSGIPIGYQRGLVFSDPAIIVYSDDADIPIHEDAGTGETTPAYEISFLSSITLSVNSGFVTISTPSEADYFSPLWTQTNKIIKTTVYK